MERVIVSVKITRTSSTMQSRWKAVLKATLAMYAHSTFMEALVAHYHQWLGISQVASFMVLEVMVRESIARI